MHSLLCAWNSFLLSSGILVQSLEPKTLRWETLGLYPYNASNGVTPTTDLWGTLFYKYEAQFTASAQREAGRCLAWRMHVSISFSDLFFLLAMPIFCGVYGTECSIQIPSDSQKLWKYPLMYSPPLSYLIDLIFLLKLFSTIYLKTLKVSKLLIFVSWSRSNSTMNNHQ